MVSGGRTEAQELLDAFFHDRGWARRERGEGRIDYECGSRRRTILLGALAGEGFFLTAPVELREREPGTEVRYRWVRERVRHSAGPSAVAVRPVRISRPPTPSRRTSSTWAFSCRCAEPEAAHAGDCAVPETVQCLRPR